MKYNAHDIIGQVVAENFRTAQIFKKHKIDFCCNGNRTIADSTEAKKIDLDIVLNDLNNLPDHIKRDQINFDKLPIDLLVDYIIKVHHKYVNDKVPDIMQFIHKVKSVHGGRHPELHEIYDLFQGASMDLLAHMKKEEMVLFPYAKNMFQGLQKESPPFGTVKNPIQMMMREHENEGERFRKLRELTQDYTPPTDACETYKVAFAMLEEFEEDLHKHIHLENNILFPQIVKMEETNLVQMSHLYSATFMQK